MTAGFSIVAVFALAAFVTPASAIGWRPYVNARYGTSVEVPDWLKQQPPSENGDGALFTAPDGSLIVRVYASYGPSVVTDSFEAYRAWTEKTVQGDGTAITYRTADSTSFTFSGVKAGRIIYSRTIAGCADRSAAHTVELDYATAQKAAFDALVAHVAHSLRADRRACN